MNDDQLVQAFGLTKTHFNRLRKRADFPLRFPGTHKTDSHAVDAYFNRESGLHRDGAGPFKPDGEETF